LIVSAAETSQELFSEFATVNVGGVTLYRKRATHSSTIPAVPAFDEDRLGVQLLRPARILSGEPEERITDEPVSCESTARLTFSHEQALELYEQARYGKLEESLAALPVEGNHASALLLLARAYANQGKLAEALGWCDKAVAADRMTAAAYYLRATILQEQGSVSEVVLALKQALYVEPQFVLGHFSLGNLALQQGRQKESDKHFDNVLLLLAQYGPQEIVPESDGLSARRLREMIVSQRGGMPSIELSSGISRRGGELSVQRAGTR
jgi:chemotaxis protein methyltransferase CheR